MSRKPNVFVYDNKCFIVLDGLIGGRITGENQDTITVFYSGGGNAYYHIGENAEDVLNSLIQELRNIKIFDNTSAPIPDNFWNKDWNGH